MVGSGSLKLIKLVESVSNLLVFRRGGHCGGTVSVLSTMVKPVFGRASIFTRILPLSSVKLLRETVMS